MLMGGGCMVEVLVVEDDEDIQELIFRYLAELDVGLRFASSGEEGVRLYEEMLRDGVRPDVVVMDLQLPGMDGVEATRRICGMDKDAVVYGFTAFFETEWADRLLKAGAKGVIGRPVGMDGFREKIREILDKD